MGGKATTWDAIPLDDLTEEETPITYGVVKPGEEGEVPFVRGGDIAGGRVLIGQLRTIGRDVSQQYQRTLLRGGEILVSLVGNPGQIAIAPPSLAGANIARQVGLVRLKPGIDTRFVSYFLQSRDGQTALGAQSLGSVQQVINLRDLKTVKVPLPPLAEQKAIAAVLGALDDKIELNRRMNATLEAMARALFQSWFIDFDPVRRNADRDQNQASTQPLGHPSPIGSRDRDEGLVGHDKLFPDSFQDSELGHIPKGWKVRTIESVCKTVTRGVTPEYQEGTGRFIINQRVNRGSDLDWSSLKELSQGLEVPPERCAKRWDVLVNCLGEGTLGRTHLYKGESDIYAIDQHMSICRAEHPSGGAYIFQVLSGADGQAKIESLKTGSTGMTMFNISKLRTFELVWPSAEILAAYFKTVEPLWLRIANNDQESRTLATLRDTLLPKLLSGEWSAVSRVCEL